MKRVIIRRYIFLTLALAIAGIIFWFSNQPAAISDEESRGFIWTLLNALPYFSGMSDAGKLSIIESINTFVRKTAHFSIYAALGFCVINYIITYVSSKKKAIVISSAICFLYACSDEIHQLFISGRSGEMRDVMLDTCGAFTGGCIMLVLMYIVTRLRRGKK